jgi:hypothetical protein
LAGIDPAAFSEVLVTEYQPGAGIGWHRDALPFGLIAGISLASACQMHFQRRVGSMRETSAIEVPPRSLYLLTGSEKRVAAFDPTREDFAVFDHLQNTEAGMLTGRLVLNGTILIKTVGSAGVFRSLTFHATLALLMAVDPFGPLSPLGRVFSSF